MPFAPERLGRIAVKAHEPQRGTSKATVLGEGATRTGRRSLSLTPTELQAATTTYRLIIEDLTGMSKHEPLSDGHPDMALTSAYGRLGSPDDARKRRADHGSGIEVHRGS